jgi:hypothetical protein
MYLKIIRTKKYYFIKVKNAEILFLIKIENSFLSTYTTGICYFFYLLRIL